MPPAKVALAAILTTAGHPVAGQDLASEPAGPSVTSEQALDNARALWRAQESPPPDPCASEQANAGPDMIIVCRQWESGERYLFEREPQRLVGAEVRESGSGAPRAPNFNNSCLNTRGRENCNMMGRVPPPAIMIDFSALPETPAGSEAAQLYGGPTDADDAGN